MKRIFLFTISLILVFAMLSFTAGCASNNTSSVDTQNVSTAQPSTAAATTAAATSQYGDTGGLKLPIVDKPLKISCTVVSDYPDRSNSFFAKELLKRTGIELDIQSAPATEYPTKIKMIIASGQLPDIVYQVTLNDINSLGTQGSLVPINKYIDQLPNFKSTFVDNKDNSWILYSYSAPDNNLYLWPLYQNERDVNHGFLYRKDIFDKNGLKEWNTTDEFYEALKRLKELYPDSIPYASKTKDQIFYDWAFGWGVRGPSSSGSYASETYDGTANTWKLGAVQPEYKDMLDFMKKLYNEGLLDPEFITDTPASWTEKMTQNERSFVTWDWIGRLGLFYDQVKDKIPEYDLRYANPIGPVGKIRSLPKIENYGFCVSNSSHSLEVLKFLDYLLSPSGTELSTMGVEGVQYSTDASGKTIYPEIPNKLVQITDLDQKYGVFMMGLYARVDKRSVYFQYTDKEQEAQDKMLKNNKIVDPYPILKYTDEEQESINDLEASLAKAASEFSTKYVLDKSYGQSQWDDWVKKADSLGASKLMDVYNAAQKRYDASK